MSGFRSAMGRALLWLKPRFVAAPRFKEEGVALSKENKEALEVGDGVTRFHSGT